MGNEKYTLFKIKEDGVYRELHYGAWNTNPILCVSKYKIYTAPNLMVFTYESGPSYVFKYVNEDYDLLEMVSGCDEEDAYKLLNECVEHANSRVIKLVYVPKVRQLCIDCFEEVSDLISWNKRWEYHADIIKFLKLLDSMDIYEEYEIFLGKISGYTLPLDRNEMYWECKVPAELALTESVFDDEWPLEYEVEYKKAREIIKAVADEYFGEANTDE